MDGTPPVQEEDGGTVHAVVGDMRAPEAFRHALGPQDLVLVTATPAIPVGSRVDRRRFLALKTEATAIFANSLALARELGAGLILTSGASFRARGDEVADETWPIHRGGLATIGTDTDPLIDEAMRTGSPPKAVRRLPVGIRGD